MAEKTINIGVTGLNAIDSPGPGVSVIRGLRESTSFKVRIIGLAYESLEPGIYIDGLVDKTYLIPYPSEGTEVLLSRLEYIQAIEKLDAIIPNFDAELYSFMKLEKALKSIGISMFLPALEQFEERHKVNLNDFGKKYSMKVPESSPVITPSGLSCQAAGSKAPETKAQPSRLSVTARILSGPRRSPKIRQPNTAVNPAEL